MSVMHTLKAFFIITLAGGPECLSVCFRNYHMKKRRSTCSAFFLMKNQ